MSPLIKSVVAKAKTKISIAFLVRNRTITAIVNTLNTMIQKLMNSSDAPNGRSCTPCWDIVSLSVITAVVVVVAVVAATVTAAVVAAVVVMLCVVVCNKVSHGVVGVVVGVVVGAITVVLKKLIVSLSHNCLTLSVLLIPERFYFCLVEFLF